MRHDAQANRPAKRGAAEALLDDQPREHSSGTRGADGVRVGHIGEMDVRDAANHRLRGGAFDPRIVEADPCQFHRLDRNQERRQGN